MQFNQSQISQTSLGKFIGCAIAADLANIALIDMSNVDLKILLDGREVDLRAIFARWHSVATAEAAEARAAATPQPATPVGRPAPAAVTEIPDPVPVPVNVAALEQIMTEMGVLSSELLRTDEAVRASYEDAVASLRTVFQEMTESLRVALEGVVQDNAINTANYSPRATLTRIQGLIASVQSMQAAAASEGVGVAAPVAGESLDDAP